MTGSLEAAVTHETLGPEQVCLEAVEVTLPVEPISLNDTEFTVTVDHEALANDVLAVRDWMTNGLSKRYASRKPGLDIHLLSRGSLATTSAFANGATGKLTPSYLRARIDDVQPTHDLIKIGIPGAIQAPESQDTLAEEYARLIELSLRTQLVAYARYNSYSRNYQRRLARYAGIGVPVGGIVSAASSTQGLGVESLGRGTLGAAIGFFVGSMVVIVPAFAANADRRDESRLRRSERYGATRLGKYPNLMPQDPNGYSFFDSDKLCFSLVRATEPEVVNDEPMRRTPLLTVEVESFS